MKIILTVALLFTLTAFQAHAVDDGLYFYAQSGQSSNVKGAATGTSYGGIVGYQYDRNWRAEVGYTSLLSKVPLSTGNTAIKGYYSVTDIAGAVAYTFPVSTHFDLLGRLGLHMVSEKTTLEGPGVFSSTSSSVLGPLYGIAVQYGFNRNFGLRAGMDFYNAKTNGASNTIENFNAGVFLKI
jgi:hypothetical protein